MRRITGIIGAWLMALALSAGAMASPQERGGKKHDRAEWFKEMSRYKADFIAGELKLTDEQKAQFVPLYESFQNASSDMSRKVRAHEREVRKKGSAATDKELAAVAQEESELKVSQAALEKEYFAKFKEVLTPRQLFEMGSAERKFTRSLMEKNQKAHRGRR